jgi:ELWxxDGT repeat protein
MLAAIAATAPAPPVLGARPALSTPNSSSPSLLVAHGKFVWFAARNDTSGYESIWRSNGTSASLANPVYTHLYDVQELFWSGKHLYISSGSSSDLFVTDGNPAHPPHSLGLAARNTEVSPGSFEAAAGGSVFFVACDTAHGCEPWFSNGTKAGTRRLRDIDSRPTDSNVSPFVMLGKRAVFSADDIVHGQELWISDGTPSGTHLLKDVLPGSGDSRPSAIGRLGARLVFLADDDVHGTEPWITDGTARGTHLIRDIDPGTVGSFGGDLYPFRGKLYFSANDGVHGMELWQTDGTAKGTRLAADIWPGPHSGYPQGFASTDDHLFFNASDAAHGLELWASDGAAAGSHLLKDLSPGPRDSNFVPLYPGYAAVLGHKLLFVRYAAGKGNELWVSSGTPGTTSMLKDLNPGGLDPYVTDVTRAGSLAFFAAWTDAHGRELWKTDGTAAGTRMVTDLFP